LPTFEIAKITNNPILDLGLSVCWKMMLGLIIGCNLRNRPRHRSQLQRRI